MPTGRTPWRHGGVAAGDRDAYGVHAHRGCVCHHHGSPHGGRSERVLRILIIDDSERLREALARGLRALGHTVDVAEDGAPGLALLALFSFDLIVLDLMMPGIDGAAVLRSIRSRKLPVRVLVLSARDQVRDRVAALDLGADDYLVKPFSFEELRARIEALGRRPVGESTE